MIKEYSFEKLNVWQDAKEFTIYIYEKTTSFPESEKFGLASQIRRASVSICCNIAEGTSRWSNKEKSRFLEISYGSLMEVLNCSIIATELNYFNENTLYEIREIVDKVSNKLNALRKSFLND